MYSTHICFAKNEINCNLFKNTFQNLMDIKIHDLNNFIIDWLISIWIIIEADFNVIENNKPTRRRPYIFKGIIFEISGGLGPQPV